MRCADVEYIRGGETSFLPDSFDRFAFFRSGLFRYKNSKVGYRKGRLVEVKYLHRHM